MGAGIWVIGIYSQVQSSIYHIFSVNIHRKTKTRERQTQKSLIASIKLLHSWTIWSRFRKILGHEYSYRAGKKQFSGWKEWNPEKFASRKGQNQRPSPAAWERLKVCFTQLFFCLDQGLGFYVTKTGWGAIKGTKAGPSLLMGYCLDFRKFSWGSKSHLPSSKHTDTLTLFNNAN